MKSLMLAGVLLAFMAVFPASAQDHSQHGHHASAVEKLSKPAKKADGKTCACCKSGHCPMMQQGGGQVQGHAAHGMAMPVPETAAERELDAAMQVMHTAMAKPYTGDADADFIRGMIPHHEGAVEMARIVLKHGDDPQARDLARRIIVAQKGEIAWMQRWLQRRQIPEHGAFRFNR